MCPMLIDTLKRKYFKSDIKQQTRNFFEFKWVPSCEYINDR